MFFAIDGGLDGVKSKQGFDDLAVDGDIEDYLGSKQKGLRNFQRKPSCIFGQSYP
jgi:hypothetical protein